MSFFRLIIVRINYPIAQTNVLTLFYLYYYIQVLRKYHIFRVISKNVIFGQDHKGDPPC